MFLSPLGDRLKRIVIKKKTLFYDYDRKKEKLIFYDYNNKFVTKQSKKAVNR